MLRGDQHGDTESMTEGVGREKTVGECSGMVGGDQHCHTESMTEGVGREKTVG